MNKTDKSSIYISIFKRKGGEGLRTKLVNDTNEKDYSSLFSDLAENEKPLLIYFTDILNWFMLTNSRILMSDDEDFSSSCLTDIVEVHPAFQEEMRGGTMDKQKFTRLKIITCNNEHFICRLEQGDHYEGIYQVLHFIANNNINSGI